MLKEFVCGSGDECFTVKSYWVISHVRMESVSDVLETVPEFADANFILTWLVT
jgi:hypothetical protein